MARLRSGPAGGDRALIALPSESSGLRDAPGGLQDNIATIVELERRALAQRTRLEQLGDFVARHVGSGTFLAIHVVWFTLWIVAGLAVIHGVPLIDPPPFALLTTIVSLEAIFLSILVLISQNRMARLADRRNHLDLQINVLAEQEITTVLQIVEDIRERLGIEPRVDVDRISEQRRTTNISALADDLDIKLPTE